MTNPEQNTPNKQHLDENLETEQHGHEPVNDQPAENDIDPRDLRIQELEAELKTAKQNEREAMLRARAEVENMRRRADLDVEKAHKFALEKFANQLLPVIDNLERGIELADKNNVELLPMIEGMQLTLKSFLDAINKFGIEVVAETNVPFNPDVHEAMTMLESAEHQANHVMLIMQKGYTLNGRLLRPAMVAVSK